MKLYLDDCLQVMPELEPQSVDLVLCDLPYGTTQCKWDTIIPLKLLWKNYLRVVKNTAVICLTGAQPFTSFLVMSNVEDFKYVWVWKKQYGSGHLNAKKQPLRIHEDVVVFYKKQPTYNPQKTFGHKLYKSTPTKIENNGRAYGRQKEILSQNLDGSRYPVTVLNFDSVDNRFAKFHPTQKPVALMEYLIRTYTNEGDTVLDNCMGSGTTGVACVNTRRKFIGIENDEKYFDIAVKRIREAKGKVA